MRSFRFTKALQAKNTENVLIIHNTILAALDTQSRQVHAKPTEPSVGREVRL